MYWLILIAANLPIYLLIGWAVFDSAEKASQTFFETLFVFARALLIPKFVRVLLDMDDEGGLGVFEIGMFVGGCIAVTYGEHFLLTKYVFE